MVPVPTPPTDSLYKYLAIAGLAAAVILYVFATNEAYKVTDRGYQIRLDESSLIADQKDLSQDIERTLAEANRTKAEQNRLEQRVKDFKDKPRTVTEQQMQDLLRKNDDLRQTADGLLRKHDDLQQRWRSNEHKRIALEEASNQWRFAAGRIQVQLLAGEVAAAALLGVSIWGFWCWYTRVQWLQDRRLQIELRQLERTGATPGPAPSAPDSPEALSTSAPD